MLILRVQRFSHKEGLRFRTSRYHKKSSPDPTLHSTWPKTFIEITHINSNSFSHLSILKSLQITTCTFSICIGVRAVDPDPHGSAFILPPGSGSRRVNFHTQKQKKARKLPITAIVFNF